MRKQIWILLLCCMTTAVSAIELPFKSGVWSGSVDTKGAVLKSLSFKGQRMTLKGCCSFEDFVSGNGGGNIELCEDFFALDFEPLSVRPERIVLSACGVGAFSGLRMTKTFAFDRRKPEFSVTWELKNIGTKTIAGGLRTRCYFRSEGSRRNICQFPDSGKMVKVVYPGAPKIDYWITNPGLAVVSIYGGSTPSGVILLPPTDLLGSLFCHFNLNRNVNTQEFFLNDQPIAPGRSVHFTIKGIGSADVPAELAKLKPEQHRIGAQKGSKLRLPFFYSGALKKLQLTYGSAGAAAKHIDIAPERQLNDSFRTIELPENCDLSALALYEIANNTIMPDRPVPFRLLKDAKGRNILKFRVPGILPGEGDGVLWREGFAYQASGAKAFLAPSQFRCRLLFRKGGVIDNTIPEGEAELIANGSFSEADSKDGAVPYGFRNQFLNNGKNHVLDLSFKKPGLRLAVAKESKRSRGQFSFPVRVERGVKYTFSTKLSCTNPLSNWIVVSLSFFDKDNKAINRSKTIYIEGEKKKALPMAVRSKSFYPPENAVRGEIMFLLYDKKQLMDIAEVSLKPEPFRAEVRSPEQILRSELTSSFVPGLDLLENLNFSTVTRHRKFFCNPAQPMPRLLYLTGNNGLYWIKQSHRRHLIELCQRAKLDFTYIPLMRKINSSSGKWVLFFANTLEPYTLLKLKNLKSNFDAVMLNQVEFSYIPKETVEQLKTFRKNGVPLIFFNCRQIPKELLGKESPVPENILATLPQMRQIPARQLAGNLKFYTKGKTPAVVWNTGVFECWNVRYLPFVPQEKASEMVHNLYGEEFPYWEYFYLAQLKVLRSASKKEGDVIVQKAAPGTLTVESKSPCKVKISTVVRDFYGRLIGKAETQTALKSGVNTVVPPLPEQPLAGGISIVDFKLCDLQGRELDCGAYKVETPALPLNVAMKSPERIFGRNVPIEFTIQSVPGAVYECEIVDSEGRSVWKQSGKNTTYSALLSFPYTRLYNLYVRTQSGDKSALLQQEFALEPTPLDPFDINAAIWMNRPAYSRFVRDLGFTMNMTGFVAPTLKHGLIRALVTDGCEPITCGSGLVLNKTQRVYRGNAMTADPVRNPCFSDPERTKKVDEQLALTLNSFNARYYGARCHIVADEADLGGSVCYSEHCLKQFREWLKLRYSSLDELNKAWDTSYKSWDDVLPVQQKELKDKSRMARYVEHRLFMNLVFARNWVGSMGTGIRKVVPDAISGLSGTQNSGLSYDWVQMTKYTPLLMYYGGNQTNAILDFIRKDAIHGQWLGYSRGFTHDEVTTKWKIWTDIFRGANLICKFPCETMIGDVSAAPNARYFTETIREIRSGAGARILRGNELGRDIGILYSQTSLLCAIANQIGCQSVLNMWNSWPALLTDLGLRFKMVSYEELEEKIPELKVIILPGAFSLTPAQIRNLTKFAENGGTVIADCGPGWYDGHGNKAGSDEAEKLFGISRKEAKLYPADAPQFHTLPLGETGLKLDGGKAGTMYSGEPVAIVKRHGKGKTLLLNLGIGSYQSITLGGVGGEDTSVADGQIGVKKFLQGLVAAELSQCKAPFKVEGVAGAKIFLRQDGANYLAGILPVVENVPRYSMLKRKTATLTFPVKGHLYLVRSGKYLGYGNSCKLALRAGDPELISILPEKVEKVEITAPAKLERGSVCQFGVKVIGGVEKHVLHIEIRRPDGTLPFGYSWNSYEMCSGGSFKFQFAHNDQPGKWKIVVRDVDSGVTESTEIELF